MKYIFLVNFLLHNRPTSRWLRLKSGWTKRPQRLLRFGQQVGIGMLLAGLIAGLTSPILAAPSRNFREMAPARVAQSLPAAQSPAAQLLLQQGVESYQAEQFAAAVRVWQQALALFVAQTDPLQQALVWNHLSVAYQQLGQWQAAEQAVAQSLSLLQSSAPDRPGYLAILAKALNTQGRLQWYQGQIELALQTWREAAQVYEEAGDRTGLLISRINQAKALQTLGFSVQAEQQLQAVAQLLQQEPDLELKATGLQNLGIALRRVGKLQESQQVLQQSLTVAEKLSAPIQSAIWLDLGNTQRALGSKALAIGETQAAQQDWQAAQASYQQAATLATSPLTTRRVQLNQLSLLIETEQWTAAATQAKALRSGWDALPQRSSLYAQLNYARSLAQLSAHGAAITQADVVQFLTTTLQQAQDLADGIAESYALGQLGQQYERAEQWVKAQQVTQQALLKAEAAQAADVRYRWEWQLGRLAEKQGDRDGALGAYGAAVESLKSVRSDLLTIGADVQFSFRDDVEPVYRGLVELLLTPEAGQPPSQSNLRQSIQQVDALQLAELNNFLGCNLAQIVAINEVKADPTAAKIYPMILPNRLAVVLELPGQPLVYHEVLRPRAELVATLQKLRQDLSVANRTPEAIAGLQQVDDWLIAPFRSALTHYTSTHSAPIQTLVFVLDGELRNVPMAALYDGTQYLVSQYAVAVAPRLSLFQPSPRPEHLNVFLGGVGEPQTLDDRAFPEIKYLAPELEQIQQILNAEQPLLNHAFTETNLEQQLQAGNFSAVHLKTHGIFSSDPEETFIVAYRELITSRDLGRLIQLGRLGEASPIELLVLSACSTAQGDSRAVLGLAGVAVQAGARSVISTLWEAQDLPNTQLMIQFYQQLLNPQVSRAEALRQAQLHLLSQGYTTPHVWATYVLVGNWL